jgi:hypothetical protein
MDDLEKRLRDSLDQAAHKGVEPAPINRREVRRIRAVQTFYAMVSVCVIGGLLFGVAWARGLGNADRQPLSETSADERVYVIDGAPDGKATQGELLALDVEGGSASVAARIPLGTDADVALAPDGSSLYSVSYVWITDQDTESRLQVIDPGTGDVISHVPLPNWQGTTGFHLTNKIAVAPDGARVVVLVDIPSGDGGVRSQGLATYDTADGRILPDVAPLDGCGGAPTILPTGPASLAVVCREVGEVRFVTISPTGAVSNQASLFLDTSGATVEDPQGNALSVGYVSQAVLSPDHETIFAVTRDGDVFVIGVDTEEVVEEAHLDLSDGDYVPVPQVAATPDGESLVLGLGKYPATNAIEASSVVLVDIDSWTLSQPVETEPFSAMSMSNSGEGIFTSNVFGGPLYFVAAPPGTQIENLGEVASRPQAIYVP